MTNFTVTISGKQYQVKCKISKDNLVGVCGSASPADHIQFGKLLSISSKSGHVTEKQVLIGCKHDMFSNQTFEV